MLGITHEVLGAGEDPAEVVAITVARRALATLAMEQATGQPRNVQAARIGSSSNAGHEVLQLGEVDAQGAIVEGRKGVDQPATLVHWRRIGHARRDAVVYRIHAAPKPPLALGFRDSIAEFTN